MTVRNNKISLSKRKPIYGAGINDADYITTETQAGGTRLRCPFYNTWANMLQRCYSVTFLAKHPTYRECRVCDEWLTFSIFKRWMEAQDWQGKCLDKDIISSGNKIYSPDTCVFITQELNKLLIDSSAIRGNLPIGVSYDKARKKYMAKCNVDGVTRFLGRFSSVELASNAYLKFKANLIREAAAINKGLHDEIAKYADALESQLIEVA